MKIHSKTEKKSLAEVMAELTCELAKTCNRKEHFFASKYDLTPAEFRCLRLFKTKSSMSIKQIAITMNLTPGRITHILTSLEEKKFIIRKVDERDKRNVIVYLTDDSIPFLKIVNDNHIKIHESILDKISPDRREFVVYAMEDVIKALKTWNDNAK